MLAKSRIIRASGFVKIPKSSMNGISGTGTFNHVGTSGQKISFQYSLVPVKLVIRNVVTPKNTVQAILPVRLPPPGGNGTIPMMFATKIKKKQVSNHGAYFGASLPRVASITSVYTDMMNMCISPTNPFGAGSSTLCFLHQRAGIRIHNNRMIASMKSTQTVFVMEMSRGRTSWPPTFSTILLGFACASAFLITRLKGPGRSPLASFSSENSLLQNTCQPVVVFTMTGR